MVEITQVILDIVSPANPGYFERKEELFMHLKRQNPDVTNQEVEQVFLEALKSLFSQPQEEV